MKTMLASELLQQFPEKSFSEVWENKLSIIKSEKPNIDKSWIDNFINKIDKVFELDNKINWLKQYLKDNESIEVSNWDVNIIKINWFNIINRIIWEIKKITDFTPNDIYNIFKPFYDKLEWYADDWSNYLADDFINRNWRNISTWKKIIDSHIEKLDERIRLIKLENKNSNWINGANLKKVESIIKQTKDFETKYPEIEKKINSFLDFEKNITADEIKKIWDFYKKAWTKIWIKLWLFFALLFWSFIIWLSFYNIHNNWTTTISSLSSIATLSIFLIFFLKQFSNNKNAINSYNFKSVSANVMEHLLTTRNNTEEWKMILEKTLDKILDEPWKNEKWSETINLVNTSLKTPWS